MATSNIWAAIRCPCRVPSSRVSSTKMLMYLQEVEGMQFHQTALRCHADGVKADTKTTDHSKLVMYW